MGFYYPHGYDAKPNPQLDPAYGQPQPERRPRDADEERIDPLKTSTSRKDRLKSVNFGTPHTIASHEDPRETPERKARSAYIQSVVRGLEGHGLLILGTAIGVAVVVQALR